MEELLPLALTQPTETDVWNKYVPITKTGINYHVYLTGDIKSPDFYNETVSILNTADTYEIVNLYINNGGGYIDSAFFIIDAIKNCRGTVVAHLSGTVASAATVITLACDEVKCADYLSFMIHNYSTGIEGKGHEVKAHQQFVDKELTRAFKEIYKGFLTEAEMDRVIEGSDIWLNELEVYKRLGDRVDASILGE